MNQSLLAQIINRSGIYLSPLGNILPSVSEDVTYYVVYVFNFLIIISGLIAFGSLVLAGFRYLAASGNTEEIKKAQEQIKSAAGGIFLLLCSYIVLNIINPQLLTVSLKPLSPINFQLPEVIPQEEQISSIADPILRIKALTQRTIEVADTILNTALDIQKFTSTCNCSRTQPFCLVRQYRGGSCGAEYCYAKTPDQPCPEITNIKQSTQLLVASRDIIIYYKNRLLAEAQDLDDEITKIIDKEINFMEKRLAQEHELLQKCESENCKTNYRNTISVIQDRLSLRKEQKVFKANVKNKLENLASLIEPIKIPSTILVSLPDKCLAGVKNKCVGSCSGGGHDTPGCFPGGCSGGNPCPTIEIDSKIQEIVSIINPIISLGTELINTIDALE